MTFAITKVQCYGQEAEEPLNKRYRQFMMLNITAANTDNDLDLGDNQTGSLGTFWDAVDGTDIGLNALKCIQDIVTRAEQFASWGGEALLSRQQSDVSGVTTIDSAASAGGNATEALTFTGLASGDTILALTGKTAGANSASIRAFGTPGTNSLSVTFTADPGAAAVVRALVQKAAGGTVAPGAGQFSVTFANKTPNFLFASGDAPTEYEVSLEWVLQPQTFPVEYNQTAV